MRVALLSQNARAGDAIGNLVAEKLTFFLDREADVRVCVQDAGLLHPAVRPYVGDWQFVASADLVIVEYGQYYKLLGLLPLLVGGKSRILFDYHGVTPAEVWTTHNREELEKGTRQRGLVWCADQALVHSRFIYREIRQQTKFPKERLQILPHGVDLHRFYPEAGRNLREEFGIGEGHILLFVGRLAPNKRVPLLVEALDRLPDCHALIVGDTGDVYQEEVQRCRGRAETLGLAKRVHFLGHVSDEALPDLFRSADVFVMPSIHEGFCIPLIEAMACGTPVVAARAAALPETVGDAGLTFVPDDADDLARQVRRVLAHGVPDAVRPSAPWRVAVVAFRYGTDFAGGAETSLRTIAAALHEAGHVVEIFTTSSQSEEGSNDLDPGTSEVDSITVHRFRLDPVDSERRLQALQTIAQTDGRISREVEQEFLANSFHCTDLLQALAERVGHLDAVIVGPYLNGLTFDVAQAFPDKTMLLPCFHDEPFAHLQVCREIYERVGSILYHSREEQELAQADLGMNHPRASCLGTLLDVEHRGDAERGRARLATDSPYLVYCGRYSVEKNVPELLNYLRRYHEQHQDRFACVFIGQGTVAIPREDWAINLGFVDEQTKQDVLSGAAALVQLSRNESLSLVALESWAQAIPVIVHQDCPVLAGHLGRCQGGQAIAGYEDFAEALDDLWQQSERWQARGRRGQAYVRSRYGSRSAFLQTLEKAIRDLSRPLREQMREAGLRRAAEHDRAKWRERFGSLVERLLDSPPLPYRQDVEVRPRIASRTVAAGQETVLIPVRVANRGTHCVVHEGPARLVLRSGIGDQTLETALPGLLTPGAEISATMRVPVPNAPRAYQVELRAEPAEDRGEAVHRPSRSNPALLNLIVDEGANRSTDSLCRPILETVHAALAEAEYRQHLPDDYLDVTEGFLASWKRWLKHKLLGNFKRAYVDVLSRRQSAFNRQIVTAIQELAECCATLDHARASDAGAPAGNTDALALYLQGLMQQLAESRRRCAELEERVARLEANDLTKEKLRL
jgi:glycosyltransferase involved in cell wall biosynthesis